ncbi:ADR375Wp [Eremothecium gossypii ATCC 10895]|uniref:ADR375Wp n=1 Tax=Eremothecium gossypii (strain ATCC 10895 / CBS 109.51 / FGSC 9923 / NRRL Y-1056) TaxID=284811 RepID=Q759A2_EREGS|nr:ADR375Wp [Eremothecium gossypii ATCC 10895]AAS52295.2 ADR375Wp [Eremothecium gossypii ATCC 10895]AEY96593.1 FADR375Wp [Eremothecium gossypii FDAG1]
MRRVLACARCRGHKIKCVHNNEPPCSYCQHKGIAEKCVLSFPPKKRRKKPELYLEGVGMALGGYPVQQLETADLHEHKARADGSDESQAPVHAQGLYDREQAAQMYELGQQMYYGLPRAYSTGYVGVGAEGFQGGVDLRPSGQPGVEAETDATTWEPAMTLWELVRQVPDAVVQRAVEDIVQSFPELRLFNMTTLHEDIPRMDAVLVGAVLAHASFFAPCNEDDPASLVPTSHWLGVHTYNVKHAVYEKLSMAAISANEIFMEPSLDLASALLLLSTIKWSQSQHYAAWMLHTCAVRMIQALVYDERFVRKCKGSPVVQEMRWRTYWCAFLLDRMICAGEKRCFVVADYERYPLPVPERVLASLSANEAGAVADPEDCRGVHQFEKVTLQNCYEYFTKFPVSGAGMEYAFLVKIYSIWGEAYRYTVGHGDFNSDKPWDPYSPIGKIWMDLKHWREFLPEECIRSIEHENSEQFIRKDAIYHMMHCLYLLTIIFLTRRYMPFLPRSCEKPYCSEFESPPDEHYWEENARRSFKATREIAQVLGMLLDYAFSSPAKRPYPVLTAPFYSFVAFTCATQCNYGIHFPWMDPEHQLYEGDTNRPTSLVFGLRKMTQLLNFRQSFCRITKNWFSTMLKQQELYRNVCSNGNADFIRLEKYSLNKLKEVLQPSALGHAPAVGRIELPVSRNEKHYKLLANNPMTSSPSHTRSFLSSTIENTAQSVLLQLPEIVAPKQGSYVTEMQHNDQQSAFPPPQAMHPVPSTQSINISSVAGFHNPSATAYAVPESSLPANSISSCLSSDHSARSEPPIATQQTRPEVEKMTLLFNDQELDLLLQFTV